MAHVFARSEALTQLICEAANVPDLPSLSAKYGGTPEYHFHGAAEAFFNRRSGADVESVCAHDVLAGAPFNSGSKVPNAKLLAAYREAQAVAASLRAAPAKAAPAKAAPAKAAPAKAAPAKAAPAKAVETDARAKKKAEVAAARAARAAEKRAAADARAKKKAEAAAARAAKAEARAAAKDPAKGKAAGDWLLGVAAEGGVAVDGDNVSAGGTATV
jgi:hypothetical protein